MVKYYYNAYGKIINKVDTSGINLSDINSEVKFVITDEDFLKLIFSYYSIIFITSIN